MLKMEFQALIKLQSFWKQCRALKGGTEETTKMASLPCITILVTFSPDNDNDTTAGEAEQSKEKTQIKTCNNQRNLTEVAEGGGATPCGGVAIVDTCHHEQLLGHRGGHDASTTGGRDETHQDRATAAGHLAGHGVGLTDLVTPVTSPDGDDGQLGQDDGTTDGCGHLFGALHAQTHVAVVVANGNKGLETRANNVTSGSTTNTMGS